jgi:hypothetical protein
MKILLNTSLMISFLLIGLGSITAETAKTPDTEINSKIPLSAEEVSPIAVGNKAPNANLRTTTGEAVTIDEISPKKPKILIFTEVVGARFAILNLDNLLPLKANSAN